MNNSEKKEIHSMMSEIWLLSKDFIFDEMGDEEWEHYIAQGNLLSQHYKDADKPTKKLFCDLYCAFHDYAEAKQKERKLQCQVMPE